ncbi:hypothetical protein [Millisia brevis]|uniref:hypothetical protein n=1 Tax=Millisia brevis TaxID=264148 RepID=UPI000833E12E|nr:hypothetical protein [Millisia brevis]
MSSRWPGRLSRSSDREDAIAHARTASVSAFLDLEARQSAADRAVESIGRGTGDAALREQWTRVRELCYAAGARYLAVTERMTDVVTEEAFNEFTSVTEQLSAAARAVDDFYLPRREILDAAVQRASIAPQLAGQARVAARAALTADSFAGYRTVVAARGEVAGALNALDAATGPEPTLAAARRVREAVAGYDAAIVAAPEAAGRARSAIASVRTRIEGIHTRVDRLSGAYSALLREFVAAASEDVTGNRRRAEDLAAAATEHVDQARRVEASDPDTALDLIGAARSELREADELVAQVVDRLTALREVRDHPEEVERRVNFRLRDAQRYAVNRGLVAEWGSVLDAQHARIRRARAELDGQGRPDHWRYLREMRAIEEFIATTVDRMRGSDVGGH